MDQFSTYMGWYNQCRNRAHYVGWNEVTAVIGVTYFFHLSINDIPYEKYGNYVLYFTTEAWTEVNRTTSFGVIKKEKECVWSTLVVWQSFPVAVCASDVAFLVLYAVEC